MNKLGAAFGPAFMRNVDGKQSIVQNEICRSIITHYDMLFLVPTFLSLHFVNYIL